MKKLWPLLFTAAAACSGNPLQPAHIDSASFNRNGPNAETVTNVTGSSEYHTYIVWDVTFDAVNQVEVNHSVPTVVVPGVPATISIYVEVTAGHCYQMDDYLNMPPADHYTQSYVRNYFSAGYEHYWPTGCSTTPPTTPVPPIIPPPHKPVDPCSPGSFISMTHAPRSQVTVTGIEVETIVVAPGKGPVTVYLMSWGVPLAFLPQTRTYQTQQVLYDGPNIMTVAIAARGLWYAWQMECGCEPGPDTLTKIGNGVANGGQFSYIDYDLDAY